MTVAIFSATTPAAELVGAGAPAEHPMHELLLTASANATRSAAELEKMADTLGAEDPNRHGALGLAGALRALADRLDAAEVY